jgi:hypothetical protein
LTEAAEKSDLSVPTTREEAYALTLEELVAVAGRVAAFVGAWDDGLVEQFKREQGEMVIDSALGVFVVTLLTEEFDEDLIDFGKIDVNRWRNIGEVASIVFDAVQGHRASHE